MTDEPNTPEELPDALLAEEDIPAWYLSAVRDVGRVAWDIETTGLDWRADRIGTCQLYVPGKDTVIVKVGPEAPPLLAQLLADGSVIKLFHHAMFDLRFMSHTWDVEPDNVACTKVAAKILYGNAPDATTSLKGLLELHLGVELDKAQQVSDWTAADLTGEQLAYAASDVLYLFDLLYRLETGLEREGRLELARACYAHVQTRVKLDILGLPDVYTH